MKKNNFLTLLFAGLTAAAILVGCKKDDSIDPKPSISVTSPSDNSSISTGDNVNLVFTASSNNELKKLIVKRKVAGGSDVTVFDKTLPDNTTSYKYDSTFTAGPIGEEIYTITLTDKKDLIETKTLTISITDGLGVEKTGSFYHIQGSLNGAYDLVADISRSFTDADAEKDMENIDAAGGTFTGSWKAGAGNTTTYVKAIGFDYSNATAGEAIDAYNAGAKLTSVAAPSSSDVYIARLRNGSTYAVIQIESIAPSNDDCSCLNKGKITFNYKKTE